MSGRRRVSPFAGAFAGAALIALGAPPAWAQDARLAAISDADTRAAIGSMIAEAERVGLPREPLVTKALEGVEKGAPAPRIEAAVRALAGRLVTARAALGPLATAEELRAAADALAAGVTPEAVRSVRSAAPNRSVAVALGVLAQLAARGVPSDRAATSVSSLVSRGAGTPQLLALQRGVQDDLAAGKTPAAALELRYRALIIALPPPIQGSFPTAIPGIKP